MEQRDIDRVICVLVRQGYGDLAEAVVVMASQVSGREKLLEDSECAHAITQSDRDNRRRRMDLARAILDETQVHDLDKVAEIIWPVAENEYAPVMHPVAPYPCGLEIPGWGLNCELDINHSGPHYNQGMGRLVESDPTQVPSGLQTQDGQPIYRQGSQVQSVPFSVPKNHVELFAHGMREAARNYGCPPGVSNFDPTQIPTKIPDPEICNEVGINGIRRCYLVKGHRQNHKALDGVDWSMSQETDFGNQCQHGVPYAQECLDCKGSPQDGASCCMKCDGNHGGPACADPECYARDDHMVTRLSDD